jgi:predicted phage terminase large subunit-like protein
MKFTTQQVTNFKLACQTNLGWLCKEILWKNQAQKDWAPVHEELKWWLKRDTKRKLILLPRNHLKSAVVTQGWTIQQVLKNHDLRVLIASDTWSNAKKFLGSIQKFLVQSMLSLFYGPFPGEPWTQDECVIRQRRQILNAPTWVTTGIEKEQTSQHYDLIVLDDIVARDNCGSKELRDKVKQYYRDSLDWLEPGGRIVVIGTRWHQDDLYGMLMEPGSGFDVFIRQAYTDETETEVIFPQKFSLEYLNELREPIALGGKGAYEFSSQYKNNPIDQEAADFKSEWLRFYDPGTTHPGSLYLTIDPALSLSRDADFTAMVVAGMFRDRTIRVVDRRRVRVVPSDLVNHVFELVEKWNLHRIGIETFAFQKTLKYEIERQQRERGIFFTIDSLGGRHTGRGEAPLSKEARIRRLQPYFEQGLIELRSDMQDMVDELLAFPRGKHDDLLDALSYQLDYLIASQGGAPIRRIVPGTMADLMKRIASRTQGTEYEEFMKDLKEVA